MLEARQRGGIGGESEEVTLDLLVYKTVEEDTVSIPNFIDVDVCPIYISEYIDFLSVRLAGNGKCTAASPQQRQGGR
jgi:hypothetical protein